jgi:Phage tail tube protein.
MAKVAGTAKVTIDGVTYLLRGNMEIAIGGVQRESVNGLDGHHGFKEIPTNGSISMDLTDAPDIDWNLLEEAQNATVQVALINGKSAILRNAAQMNKLSLSADNGQVSVKFEGPKGEWLPNQQQTAATNS